MLNVAFSSNQAKPIVRISYFMGIYVTYIKILLSKNPKNLEIRKELL